jgi:hypothetical protein
MSPFLGRSRAPSKIDGSDPLSPALPTGFILTAEEGFNRKDSGQYRYFDETPDGVQNNSAFQALLRFNAAMMSHAPVTPRPFTDTASPELVSTVFQASATVRQTMLRINVTN